MQFRLSIDCDNDSFSGEPGIEIARILRDVAGRIGTVIDGDYWPLLDQNGNNIGSARFDGCHAKIGQYSSHVFCQTWEELKEAMAIQNSIHIDDTRANPDKNTPESSKYADRNDDSQ